MNGFFPFPFSVCVGYCAACSNNEECTTCEAGYGLTDAKLCEKCPQNCKTCGASNEVCDDCEDKFALDSGTCHGEKSK